MSKQLKTKIVKHNGAIIHVMEFDEKRNTTYKKSDGYEEWFDYDKNGNVTTHSSPIIGKIIGSE